MLTLRKFNLKDYVWSQETEAQPIIYRNTLLGTMYPELDIAIGDASEFMGEEESDIDGAIAAFDRGFEGYQIVGASGSRKKGYAFFVRGDNADCFSRFFGSPSNCINYGSNLVTNCSNVFEMKVTILVVPDGEYGTGDCHGKCSRDFALGTVGQLQRPFQFRGAVKAKHSWVAKGTIAFAFDTGGYDLVLPESCFKGNKVKPGVYNPKTLYFGVVHQAEMRHVKMSYSVTQYLPWSAVEADILPGTLDQAKKLVYLQSNTRELAQFLTADKAIDCEEEVDYDTYNAGYSSPIAEIVEADIHEQIIEHPWIARKVKELLRKRWLKLATAGAVQFQSCMTMPDDSLPANTVCIPHLPVGEVIVFPYPCRWKHDLKIWHNVHSNQWRGYEGIIAGSHSTMLQIARDFDGDYVQFLPASLLPNVAAAVKEFGEPDVLTKPAKQKVDGTLGEITVRSMDNCVGLITYTIAKCWALDNHDEIPLLAQQLQIEVDSLKNVERADREYVAGVLKSMGRQKVYWLSDKDNLKTFTEKPISVCGEDTISNLAAAVNAIWKPALLKERSLIEFIDLFPDKFQMSWLKRASHLRDEYMARIKSTNGDKNQIIEVIKHYKEIAAGLKDYQKFPAACSFWRSCHVQKSGTASLVFQMFKEEIKQQLAVPQFGTLTIVGGDKNDYAGHKWIGVEEYIQIVESDEERFKDRLEVWIGEYFLGLLARDSAKYPSGTLLPVSLKTYKSSIFARVI